MISKAIAWFLTRPQVFLWLLSYCARSIEPSLSQGTSCWVLFNGRRISKWLPTISVEHMLRSDCYPHLHNMMYSLHAFLLAGSYTDVYPDGGRIFNAGDVVYYRHNDFRRTSSVSPGGIYVLIVMYGGEKPWGYAVNGKIVGPAEYEASRKEKLL